MNIFKTFMGVLLVLQSFLDKNIDEIKIFGQSPTSKLHNKNFYSAVSKDVQYAYGMPYDHVMFRTNDNGFIERVTLNVTGLINGSFYYAFIEDFGKPSTIQIIDTTKIISETEGANNQIMRKSFITTREGTFEEQPLFINWNKNDFEIKIQMKYSENRTRISFITKN